MNCPNCGSPRIELPRKPQRFAHHDDRIGECAQCRHQVRIRSEINAVSVFNPITEEAEWVPIKRFQEDEYSAIIRGLKPHPARVAFEQEHGRG